MSYTATAPEKQTQTLGAWIRQLAVYRRLLFGKVGRIASEEVIIQLILNKCMPILMYDLEAWSI